MDLADVGHAVIESLRWTGSDHVPSFREVADAIEARARAGEWSTGEKIPSTTAFGVEYGVSEATAYRALVLLVDRGVLRGEPGRGRYVVDDLLT